MHSYLIVVYYALSVEIDIVVMASIKPQHSADVTRDTNVSYSSVTFQSMVLKVFSNNLIVVLLWHALCCKSLYTFYTLHKTHKCVTEAKQLVNHRHKTLLHTLYRPTLSVTSNNIPHTLSNTMLT